MGTHVTCGISMTLVGSLLVLATTTCSSTAVNDDPDIVLIVVDTLRRDRLPFYGYERDTAPNLTRLAEHSRRYDQAYSVSSWTAPAHASLFTGLYPIAHGTTQGNWMLNPGRTTLAERLTDLGYHTVGVTENPVVSRWGGFNRGFAEFYETWQLRTEDEHEGRLALRWARRSLAAAKPERPLFLFVNFSGIHNPYDSSEQFRNRFLSDPSVQLRAHWLGDYYQGLRVYSKPELRHLNELYDAEILMVDHLIGELVKTLKSTRVWENTIFIVTSDHGENIGDHGHIDHVFSIYDTTFKIPLLIHYPPKFAEGSVDNEPTQLTDLYPTLMSVLGVPEFAEATQGTDLLEPRRRVGRSIYGELYRPEQVLEMIGPGPGTQRLARYDRHLDVVIREQLKLIRGSDGRSELYDLAVDPGETRNLIDDADYAAVRGDLVIALGQLAERFRQVSRPDDGRGTEIDDTTRDALRRLGYVQ